MCPLYLPLCHKLHKNPVCKTSINARYEEYSKGEHKIYKIILGVTTFNNIIYSTKLVPFKNKKNYR